MIARYCTDHRHIHLGSSDFARLTLCEDSDYRLGWDPSKCPEHQVMWPISRLCYAHLTEWRVDDNVSIVESSSLVIIALPSSFAANLTHITIQFPVIALPVTQSACISATVPLHYWQLTETNRWVLEVGKGASRRGRSHYCWVM